MNIGLDPAGFDCSGLVLRALAEARGLTLGVNVSPQLRHTRQLWEDARTSNGLFRVVSRSSEDISPGSIAVFGHVWDLDDGTQRLMPSHVGVMVSPTHLVHANYSRDVVSCVPLIEAITQRRTFLGYMALNPRYQTTYIKN